MAYSLSATGWCARCSQPATREVFNRWHGSEGCYCGLCTEAIMDRELLGERLDLPEQGGRA